MREEMMFADPFCSFRLVSALPGALLAGTHGGCRQIGKSATSEIGCAPADLTADPYVGKPRAVGKHRLPRSSSRGGALLFSQAAHH